VDRWHDLCRAALKGGLIYSWCARRARHAR
jgi:hypothetical protein